MKEVDKKRISNNGKSKRSGKVNRRDPQPDKDNAHKVSIAKETESKALQAMPDSGVLVSELNASTEPSEAYESLVIHYVDDVNRSKKMPQDSKANSLIGKLNKNGGLDDHSSDLEKESKQGEEEESDCETVKDSVSSHGDSSVTEDEKVERASRVPNGIAKSDSGAHGSSTGSGHETNKSRSTVLQNIPKEVTKTGNGTSQITTEVSSDNSDAVEIPHKPSLESSEGIDEKPNGEVKDDNTLDSIGSDNEKVFYEENGEHEKDAATEKRIEEMEIRIERLEEELREVAALEISLYSVIPEHGSSAHKVHTPARRLSRLYIHAGKYYSQDKRATIAKNTISGLVLVAKSCGNDVPRLSFWLSNTIVLREIICQSFGSSRHSSPVTRFSLLKPATHKRKGSAGGKQINGFMQFLDDWQETGTLIAALEKVESWIFSRIVESVWWEALTPNMQSPSGDKSSDANSGKLLWPALGDKQQSSFSIDLWKSAFQDAFQLICPVRAGGHECGCLPVLARMVMEHCVSRLDVAMFNAILRESVHEIPTDPVSDPILDSRVLPIPAGDLSFGSGAQLKNSIGNWSRWLTDMFGMDTDDHLETDQDSIDDDDDNNQGGKQKSFHLLSSLSDLLMLPKDMLMDRSIRKEVCPSITLPLVKRILCNFTPDEFSPEAVPGTVLESLNAESIVERRVSGETARSFPYSASPIIYMPPSSAEVATKVAEAGGKSELSRSASVVQRKGYTSDEELDELDCPLTSFIQSTSPSPSIRANGNGNHEEPIGYAAGANERYELLREVWSV